MLKVPEISFWINLLKVYLGNAKFNSSEYNQIVEHVKYGDENFAIQNENIVKLLTGCTIAIKMDEKNSRIADCLCLALLTSQILPSVNSIIPELIERAFNLWISKAEENREINLDFYVNSGTLKSSFKVVIPEVTNVVETQKSHSDSVINMITNLQKDLNATNTDFNSIQNSLKSIKQNFVALSEESNVLWWLFGSYSTTLKKSFNKLTAELLSIIIAFELNNLTKSLPGMGGVEGIIHRALSSVEYESGSMHTIDVIIDSIKGYEDNVKILLPDDHSEIQFFTPFLFGIKCHSEHAGIEWKTVYKKHVDLDLETKVVYDNFSFQLYKELAFINVYENIKN
jgi:hypothetical protein